MDVVALLLWAPSLSQPSTTSVSTFLVGSFVVFMSILLVEFHDARTCFTKHVENTANMPLSITWCSTVVLVLVRFAMCVYRFLNCCILTLLLLLTQAKGK